MSIWLVCEAMHACREEVGRPVCGPIVFKFNITRYLSLFTGTQAPVVCAWLLYVKQVYAACYFWEQQLLV